MLSGLKPALLSAAILFPVVAHGACVQSDLTGTWRFNFDSGGDVGGRTRMTSCVLVIKASGGFNPATCETLFGNADTGSVQINTPRPLVVNNSCEVTLGGSVVFVNDIGLQMGNTTYSINAFRMTLNRSKDVMIGYGSAGDLGNVMVMAVKRD